MGKVRAESHSAMLHALNIALQEEMARIVALTEERGFYVAETEPGSFEVNSTSGPVAVFSLLPLPGCCGVVVSHHTETVARLRNKGLGDAFLRVRIRAARALNYGAMLATVLKTNRAEQALLGRNGWVLTGELRNPKTGNLVEVHFLNL